MAPLRALQYTHSRVPEQYGRGFFEGEFGRIERAVMSRVTRTITVSGKQTPDDWCVFADATAAPLTYTLLPPRSSSPTPVTIKKTDAGANAVTIGGTVDGVVNPTLAAQYKTMTLVSDGTAWYKIAVV